MVDFFNGIMVIPNLIALLLLSGVVAKVLKDYNNKIEYKVEDYIK